MARYYFHVRDGKKLIKDVVGAEFDNVRAAFEHAEKAARTTHAGGANLEGTEFEVEDELGVRLFNVPFTVGIRTD